MANMDADAKKKLFILLGLAGVLGVVLLVLYNPFSSSGSAPTPVAPTQPTPTMPGGGPSGLPGSPPSAPPSSGSGAGGLGAPPVAATTASLGSSGTPILQLASTNSPRTDPFVRPLSPIPAGRYGLRIDTVRERPVPTPEPAVPLPQPDFQLAPATPITTGPEIGHTGGVFPVGGSNGLVGLAPPSIRSYEEPALGSGVLTPPRQTGATGNLPQRSPNKRVSGVIIGDSVRALLEITTGDQVNTYVVQPGQEVEGITILGIERVTTGGRTITRMTIRENGEERFVDLQPSPNPQTAPGVAGGSGGPSPSGSPTNSQLG